MFEIKLNEKPPTKVNHRLTDLDIPFIINRDEDDEEIFSSHYKLVSRVKTLPTFIIRSTREEKLTHSENCLQI